MAEPVWLDRPAVLRAHDEVVALTGGAVGVRDIGLLESALARPENVFAYEGERDVLVLAATYAVGIARNHPFIDGNKRAAFVGMAVFLGRNGFRLTATQSSAIEMMLGVAAGEIDTQVLTAWLRDNTIPR
ncbi:MAG: type II toxin-antitoxin system death-on-curing family toxin [Pseudomonadota bacterium]